MASTTNGVRETEDASPLNIVICGAGIGGLAAAIGLRKQGHKVTLLEQWDGMGETGRSSLTWSPVL